MSPVHVDKRPTSMGAHVDSDSNIKHKDGIVLFNIHSSLNTPDPCPVHPPDSTRMAPPVGSFVNLAVSHTLPLRGIFGAQCRGKR